MTRHSTTIGAGLAGLALAAAVTGGSAQDAGSEPPREARVLWVHPVDAGRNAAEMDAFLERSGRANIDTFLVLVKGMNGEVYWHSAKFPQAIAPAWREWDLLGELVPRARARGIEVHAWLVDFVETERGAGYRQNPGWAQLNPDGLMTNSETLGVERRPYPYVWMCPAQRPGYTDQWLLPMVEEIASSYEVHGIHHDYVRYPGDVAPEAYCFDDYCLTDIPRHALLAYEARAQHRHRVHPVQARIEANWWSDPTMVPERWEAMDRREKADFLLNGRTIPLGPPDMRFFFYGYRVQQIDRFVRESWETVRRVNPKLELSASVFKNPIQSARFIGQQWHRWNPWIDFYTPMTYRSHFAGDFETYLDRLEEVTARQLEWIRRERPLHAGIATTYLYREEHAPIDELREHLRRLRDLPDADEERQRLIARLEQGYAPVRDRLRPLDAEREKRLAALVHPVATAPAAERAAAIASLDKALADLRLNPPPGYLPPEKLGQAIAAARRANPDGIAIFSAGSLTREHLWPALEAAFAR